MSRLGKIIAACGLLTFGAGSASAELIGGVEFPQGAISFADSFISYIPGPGGAPSSPHQGAFNALGAPNYSGVNSCASQAVCSFVSLGVGGTLVVRFIDNVLTGSGTNAFDLWIFEVGPDVEGTSVDLSINGTDWLSVGSIGGSTRGIDIDAFGYGADSAFSFVRLIDNPNQGGTGSGGTVGADIDAVGAISTRFVPPTPGVPEPESWAMFILGFGLLGGALRRGTGKPAVRFA